MEQLGQTVSDTMETPQTPSPTDQIKESFQRLVQVYKSGQDEPYGRSTICVAVLDKQSGHLDMANLGDSQIGMLRDGKFILKTLRQQSKFNAPLQLTLRPSGEATGNPCMAGRKSIQLQNLDIIILGTDGLWDNFASEDVEEMTAVLLKKKGGDWGDVGADELVMLLVESARQVARDVRAVTPFEVEASKVGRVHTGGYICNR